MRFLALHTLILIMAFQFRFYQVLSQDILWGGGKAIWGLIRSKKNTKYWKISQKKIYTKKQQEKTRQVWNRKYLPNELLANIFFRSFCSFRLFFFVKILSKIWFCFLLILFKKHWKNIGKSELQCSTKEGSNWLRRSWASLAPRLWACGWHVNLSMCKCHS